MAEGIKVKAVYELMRNADGVVRVLPNYTEWEMPSGDSGNDEFSWIEHNNSCDCNRYLYFQRAANEPDDADAPCGDQVFYSLKVTSTETGEILYKDGKYA